MLTACTAFAIRIVRFRVEQIDAINRHRLAYFVGGAALFALQFFLPAGKHFGILLGFELVMLGIYSGVLRNWRTEPGLWMMAALLVVLLGPIYFYFAYSWYCAGPADGGFVRGSAARVLEISLSLALFWMQVKLAFSVLLENLSRTKSRPRKNPQQ